MPRTNRKWRPGAVYHLISRFVEARYFISNVYLRHNYLKLMSAALRRSDWLLFAYALMSNHIHLAALAGRKTLASWLRPVHAPFAEIVNEVNERIGPVFVRGPKAYAVPNHRVGHLIAYIHNNPVRANVCNTAVNSTWTSHRAYVGVDEAPPWLHVTRALTVSGVEREGFDEWVNDPDRTTDRSFSEAAHEQELRLAKRPPVIPADEVANAIVNAVSITIGVSTARIVSGTRGAPELLARAAAVHCACLMGLSEQRIANALNISQQRVSVLRRRTPSNDAIQVAMQVTDDLRELCAGA